jgi:predicted negative regulator of RcsB-dependent stress response
MKFQLRHESLIALLIMLCGFGTVKAQDADEITLLFGYPAVGQVYIGAAFRGDQPMIAAGELMSLLMIPFTRTDNRMGYKGAYPFAADRWEVDPVNNILLRRGERIVLKADKFYIGETDLFLTPDVLNDLFGFELTVNSYALVLSLVSPRPLPVEEKLKRDEVRRKLKEQAPENLLISYPMLYPRKRAILAPGMLDYNIGSSGRLRSSQMSYSMAAGIELLGGDFQTSVGGLVTENFRTFNMGASRWQYVFKQGLEPDKNPWISTIQIGAVPIAGSLARTAFGVNISNNPVVPRRVLDLFAIEGFTTADSEVELLVAGQLVDFTRADELGYYRFNVPLSYGTVRIGIRIYTPQGEVLFEERQLQIPFTFVPRGLLTYNVQARMQRAPREDSSLTLLGRADVAYGLTNNITTKFGVNRVFDSISVAYQPFVSASTRLFDQYLVNVDYIPNSQVRTSASVFYANNTAISIQYGNYFGQPVNDFVNTLLVRDLQVGYFLPFQLFGKASGIRFGYDRLWLQNGETQRFQGDYNTRIGPLISRFNYREERVKRDGLEQENQRLATVSLTYTIPRKPGIPVFVRGMFFRTQLRHDMKRFDATALGSFQFSQTVFKTGRFTVSFDRDFLNQNNRIQFGLLYDFQSFRSSSQLNVAQKAFDVQYGYSQNFSGSFGADLRNGMILPTNRDQVGRAGVTVRTFIDANNNGIWDQGEEVIPATAIKLDQSANMIMGSDGLLRITQLQNYWTYRLTVDLRSLPDATLVPLKPKFSFVADPNRFKLIDIPLYKTGTIEGVVYNEKIAGKPEPQPGLRMALNRVGTEETETIRTFSDGTFYQYGLIPGDYTLVVDKGQLDFMQVAAHPDTLKFTIQATAEGDWIDTLQIILKPREPDSLKKDEPLTLAQLERILGGKLKTAVQAFSESQELFYRGKFESANTMADSSLKQYTTDFAIAMKGSIAFMQGDKEAATRLWAAASERNPFVSVPDTSKIRIRVSTLLPDSLVAIPHPAGPADTIPPIDSSLLAELEKGLGDQLRKSVTFFVEAQEYFYRLKFDDALASVDSSLSYYVSDHALALKGSIVYILGRQNEAWNYWYEAKARNPMISLPDLEVLDRLTTPIAEAPERNARKKLISNR